MSSRVETSQRFRQCDAGEDALPTDGAAFAALYEQYLPAIYSYLLTRVGGEEEAADLAQQVFTQALASAPRYREQGIPINAWLFRIAHNLMVDHHRRRRPVLPWQLLPASLHPAAADDVEAAVIGREDAERLHRILRRLPAQKRDLLALRFAAGLKVREIAAVLDRGEEAVRSELRRLLYTLQQELSRD